jgi:hypothetical protein
MRFSRAVLIPALAIAVAFGAAQLVRPTLANPPVTADLSAPPEVAAILRACLKS